MSRVVKVGDTPVEMGVGVNSGAWAVGAADNASLLSPSPPAFNSFFFSPR